jgi:hypothetical protein
MQATAVHRDREARHLGHYRIDCVSMAPKSVKVRTRRSIRAAGRATLRDLLTEALIERYDLDA